MASNLCQILIRGILNIDTGYNLRLAELNIWILSLQYKFAFLPKTAYLLVVLKLFILTSTIQIT